MNFKFAIQCIGDSIIKLVYSAKAQANKLVTDIINLILRVKYKIRPGRSFPRVTKKPRSKWMQRRKSTPEYERIRSQKRYRRKKLKLTE